MTIGHGGQMHDTSLNPRTDLQKLQDTAAKRIATLDYLRRTHEGTVYYLNTLHLPTPHLLSLPSFAPPKLARRAHNHLILGISLPTMLDPYSTSAPDYLRALNDILSDYETYQTLHPPDGHSSNSLGRTRLPSMFKRSANTGGRMRRTGTGGSNSSGVEAMSPPHPSSIQSPSYDYTDTNSNSISSTTAPATRSFSNTSYAPLSLHLSHTTTSTTPSTTSTASFSPPNHAALTDPSDPTETYTHLLTPHLPFTPSPIETFATLAEVLIDVYLTISRLVTTPEACSPGVLGAFQAADKRVRRLLVEGFVREVGEGVREGVRGELGGVGRVALGGLVR